MDNQQRIEGAVNFFDKLYGKVERKLYGYLWVKRDNDKQTYPFEVSNDAERLKMAELAIKLSDSKYDVYFGICGTDTAPAKYSRVTTEQVTLQPCLWTDIDCQGGNHTPDKGIYPTIEQARAFLPMEPSILIRSGYGLHAYYLLNAPLELKTSNERDKARERNLNFINAIRRNAGEYQGAVDGVQDLPRILRVPCTYNYKLQDSPALVEVLSLTDKVYSLNEFDKFKPVEELKERKSSSTNNYTTTCQAFDEIFETARIRAALECIDATPYDVWIRAGQALRSESENYFDLWVDWSRTATNFKSEDDCRRHWDSFKGQGRTLSTLFYMAQQAGFDIQTFREEWEENHKNLLSDSTTPSTDKSKEVGGTLVVPYQKPRRDGFYTTEDVAKILGVTKKTIATWRRQKIFLEDMKDHNGVYWYSKERTEQLKAVYRKPTTNNTENKTAAVDVIEVKKSDKLPTVGFDYEIPEGYDLDLDGLFVQTKKDELKRIASPIIVTRLVENADDDIHKTVLACFKGGKWRYSPAVDNDIIANKNKITTLAKYDIDVTSTTAAAVVDYIQKFVYTNNETIPTAPQVSSTGWRGDDFVYPELCGTFEIYEFIKPQAKYFAPKGDKATLLSLIRKLKSIDNFNIALGAVLAAPLVGIVGDENIVLHFWGRAGCGKTMLSKAVASLFFNPYAAGALPSANSTQAALEYFFNSRRDLPALIEDFDSIDAMDKRTQAVMRNLPYNFGNGIGRQRAKATGGLQKTIEYRGTLITNGEQPLTGDNSKGGAKRRVVELECQKDMIKPELAAEIDEVTRENHACLGRAWIAYIQEHKAEIIATCKEKRKDIFLLKNACNLVPRHMDILSTILTALIHFDKFAGFTNFVELSYIINTMKRLPSNDSISDVHRVKPFITDWIQTNIKHFINDGNWGADTPASMDTDGVKAYDIYGLNRADCVYIYPTVLKQALTNAGYAPSVLKQLADEGYLLHDSKRIDKRIRTADNRRIYFVVIPKDKIFGGEEVCPQGTNAATKA